MKRLLCFFRFKGRHDFTPWEPWIFRNGTVVKFRYCQFCGKEEVKR